PASQRRRRKRIADRSLVPERFLHLHDIVGTKHASRSARVRCEAPAEAQKEWRQTLRGKQAVRAERGIQLLEAGAPQCAIESPRNEMVMAEGASSGLLRRTGPREVYQPAHV